MEIHIGFEHNPLYFTKPLAVLACYTPGSFRKTFREMELALRSGYYLAGFFSYEAGYCFEARLRESKAYDFPLLMMGVFRRPERCRIPFTHGRPFNVSDFSLNISEDNYHADIGTIRERIARGDVYQITYCLKFRFSFNGDDKALYGQLLRQQPVPYPAYINTGRFSILSLSPERFVRKDAGRVLTEPMKGTWPRGSTVSADRAARNCFRKDSKNRAENIMIADLLRNDLGRIGGSIRWPRLFKISAYRTLFQMTSVVTGKVPSAIPLYDLFAALFPSGSVTGAPKIRAMQIIKGLEKEERRIYTGAIGYIAPNRDMYFNVPIRTLLIRNGKGEMGVGGGIVWDSTAQGEWDEGMLKARFLTSLSCD